MRLVFHYLYSRDASTMSWGKYGMMIFLMSRNANKHVLLALGVNRIALDNDEIDRSYILHVSYVGLVTPSLMRLKSSECCQHDMNQGRHHQSGWSGFNQAL